MDPRQKRAFVLWLSYIYMSHNSKKRFIAMCKLYCNRSIIDTKNEIMLLNEDKESELNSSLPPKEMPTEQIQIHVMIFY